MNNKKQQWGKTMVTDKDINDPNRGIEQALKAKTLFRRFKSFLEKPQLLPISITNRRVLIPAVEVDAVRIIQKTGGTRSTILKGEKEMQDEMVQMASKALPIVAFDPSLAEMTDTVKVGEISYCIMAVNNGIPIVKTIDWKGMRFWVIDFHNIVAFVAKENLHLLTPEIPASQIEKQREIEESELEQSDQLQREGT